MKKWIKERVEFYFIKRCYVLGIVFFPKIVGYFGARTEIRLGLGFCAVGVLFGHKNKTGTIIRSNGG